MSEDSDSDAAATDAQDTSDERGRRPTSIGGRSTLMASGLLGLLGFGTGFTAAGSTASDATQQAGAQGEVGTSSQPLRALYTQEVNGPVTGRKAVTSLVGDGLTVDAGALSAAPARPDVDAGGTPVESVSEIELGEGLTVTDDGDGTVTVGVDAGPTLSVSGVDIGERGAGDTFTVDATVAEASIDGFDNVEVTVDDATVALAITDADGATVYDEGLTTVVPPGGTLVTFGVDAGTPEVGPLTTGDYTATVTAEAPNADAGSATDAFSVRVSSLDVTSFSIPDQPAETNFTVDATVAETADSRTQGLTVTLTVDAPDGTTVYDQTIDPASELSGESTTVTFGQDDGTSAVSVAGAPDDYTATVTADARNGGPATASTTFRASGHTSAPDDLQAVLDGMDRDADGTYVVTDDHELQAMNADRSADYRLGNDIDASRTGQWNGGSGFDPVGTSSDPFDGSLDGDGHTITGLTVDRSDYVGLFGSTETNSVVENVTLEAVDMTGDDMHAGGLAGYNRGTVRESSASGTVTGSGATVRLGGLLGFNSSNGTVERSSAAVSVDGNDTVGGLIGNENGGTVRESSATGSVSGAEFVGGLVGQLSGGTVERSYATGTVDVSDRVAGGLVGNKQGGSVRESFATGDVTGSANRAGGLAGQNRFDGTILRSYATGSVDGADRAGGLVGFNDDSTIERSYATGTVTGTTNVGGLVGRGFGATVTDGYWDVPATGQSSSAGGDVTGVGTLSDTPPADKMVGTDLHDDLESDFDFSADGNWETVATDDTDKDAYPVLRALDRQDQLDAR